MEITLKEFWSSPRNSGSKHSLRSPLKIQENPLKDFSGNPCQNSGNLGKSLEELLGEIPERIFSGAPKRINAFVSWEIFCIVGVIPG